MSTQVNNVDCLIAVAYINNVANGVWFQQQTMLIYVHKIAHKGVAMHVRPSVVNFLFLSSGHTMGESKLH